MKLDVLAIGAHPDDVELGCGGTLALLAEQGRRVGIVHLTRGERGTRGTVEQRADEARSAARALGAEVVEMLDFGDGALRGGEAEEDELIAILRRFRPDLILGPAPADRHPDHGRAHRLVADVAFYAGLRRRGRGEAHRPASIFSYMQHDPFTPSLIVDVSTTWECKIAALEAYSSQLYQGDPSASGEPVTKVSSLEYWQSITGRAQHFGLLIGASYGEPFWCRTPLATRDLMSLLPSGLR